MAMSVFLWGNSFSWWLGDVKILPTKISSLVEPQRFGFCPRDLEFNFYRRRCLDMNQVESLWKTWFNIQKMIWISTPFFVGKKMHQMFPTIFFEIIPFRKQYYRCWKENRTTTSHQGTTSLVKALVTVDSFDATELVALLASSCC